MREQPGIPEELLRACARERYDLSAASVELLHIGWDSLAMAYRIVSTQGTPYLLRAKLGSSFYAPSCLIPRYLHDQEIAAVVAPLPTKQGTLWTEIEDWSVSIYPFIEGDIGWNPHVTDAQWRAIGTTLGAIHRVPLPPEGIGSLRQETFDPAAYERQARTVDAYFAARTDGDHQSAHALRMLWQEHQPTIHTMLTAMKTLATALQEQSGPLVICHADLHPGNLIRDHAGGVFVIDWDDVMLAPKERDFIFVGDSRGEGATGNSTSDGTGDGAPSFFQGYGPAEIDWVALTYYRFERIVTDLLECAHEVVFRDDLGEDARAEAAQLFAEVLAPGNGMVDAAWAAASRLPADLSIRDNA